MAKGLEISNLSLGYDSVLINSVNISTGETGFIAIMGLNGTGKTSLMSVLTGELKPKSGWVKWNGKSLDEVDVHELSKLLTKSTVSDVGLDVFTFVSLGRTPYLSWNLKLSEKDKDIVEGHLDCFNLLGLKDRKVNTLSDGERQRVFLAKACCQETPIILLDEPTAHIDIRAKREVFRTIKALSQNKLIITISHDLHLVKEFVDEVWLLSDQQLKTVNPEDLKEEDF